MTTWQDSYVNADGIQVHYYRTGGNKPQVVLDHGAMDDGLCWISNSRYDLTLTQRPPLAPPSLGGIEGGLAPKRELLTRIRGIFHVAPSGRVTRAPHLGIRCNFSYPTCGG